MHNYRHQDIYSSEVINGGQSNSIPMECELGHKFKSLGCMANSTQLIILDYDEIESVFLKQAKMAVCLSMYFDYTGLNLCVRE